MKNAKSESKRTITGWPKSQQHSDWINESVEFLTPPKDVNSSNFKERQSGSAQWRKSRGEATGGGRLATGVKTGQIVQVKQNSENIFEFEYCCATDKYKINGNDESNWEKYCQEANNFHRKVERDWNMVYLARNEDDNEKRTIEWKFNVPQNSKIEKIEILVNSAQFQTGRVIWVSILQISTDRIFRSIADFDRSYFSVHREN